MSLAQTLLENSGVCRDREQNRLCAEEVMEILGAEGHRLEDTKGQAMLTPSSAPAHVCSLLGEVQELLSSVHFPLSC
eukprot:g505.t1